jgi:hypothetical protein
MKTRIFSFFMLLLLTGCFSCSSSKTAIVPLTPKAQIEDTYTIIWNGLSEAYRFTDGQWKRDETYDYVFDVIQKRYANQWKSTKSMHRLHPDYDGRGGARDQAMYFELNYTAAANEQLQTIIHSSLGEGSGKSDKEFREQQIVLQVKDVSSFSPYNKIRITQHYQYEAGVLRETVELLKEKNGQDTPFMKMEEKAYFYVRGKLDKAPTVY